MSFIGVVSALVMVAIFLQFAREVRCNGSRSDLKRREIGSDYQREQVKRCGLAMELGSVLTQEGRCPLDSLRLQDVVEGIDVA